MPLGSARSEIIGSLTPLEYLFSLERHGIKLGLDTIDYLLTSAGNPQERYPTVHVAGTNGKGSVIAVLNAILRAAGYTVGRFTSPHLIELGERFQIDEERIGDEALDEYISYFRVLADKREWFPPTFFEVSTAIAFRWFAKREVDCALIEVGLGGRFDATNVIVPEVSAITTIELDHMRFLGETLEEIALEKAGIVKEGLPVVVSETKPGPRDVILARASKLAAPVSLRGRDFEYAVAGPPSALQFRFESDTLNLGPVRLGLAGTFQGENAATAVAVATLLTKRFPRINARAICTGLETVQWPCRLEKVLDNPPVIIDVAHNPAGARRLATELDKECVTILAVSKDKDTLGIIEALAPVTHTLILSQFPGNRALPIEHLRDAAGNHPHREMEDLAEAIELGLECASETRPLLITGSIFTAGAARRILIDRHGAPPLQF